MKIVFSTDQIYLHGGIEKVMAEKANYFAETLQHQVYIVTTEQKKNAPCYPLSSKIKLIDIGINYHRKKSYFHPSNILKIPSHFQLWKKTMATINPDVIIVCNFAFDFYFIPFTFSKIPKLKEFHSSRFFVEKARKNSNFIKKIKYKINDFFESKYTRLLLLNPDEKQFYKTSNLEVIPNPIAIKDNFQANLTATKAITAGRIAQVKGFENAILAWEIVVKSQPNWELHIFGQGENDYIDKLQALIIERQLQKNVFIKPAVADLQNTMLDYSFYVMSSHTECFPMVLLESLAIGLPIITFDCPTGPRNIVTNNEDGFIVEDQNSDALAEKILLLITDIDKRKLMGKNAKNNSKRFSVDIILNQWELLFQKLKQ